MSGYLGCGAGLGGLRACGGTWGGAASGVGWSGGWAPEVPGVGRLVGWAVGLVYRNMMLIILYWVTVGYDARRYPPMCR